MQKRKNIRLKHYNYKQSGSYFITICTQDKLPLFGDISVGADLVSARMVQNDAGIMVERVFVETISSFSDAFSDKHIIMPNHFHCIMSIKQADTRPATTVGITRVVQAFKSKTTVEYVNGVKMGLYPPFNKRVWQRNYYEHIIRNEKEYQEIWQYIDENPAKWQEDCYFTTHG